MIVERRTNCDNRYRVRYREEFEVHSIKEIVIPKNYQAKYAMLRNVYNIPATFRQNQITIPSYQSFNTETNGIRHKFAIIYVLPVGEMGRIILKKNVKGILPL